MLAPGAARGPNCSSTSLCTHRRASPCTALAAQRHNTQWLVEQLPPLSCSMACRGMRLLAVQPVHVHVPAPPGKLQWRCDQFGEKQISIFQIINSVQFSVEYNSSTLLYFCSSMVGKVWVWYILLNCSWKCQKVPACCKNEMFALFNMYARCIKCQCNGCQGLFLFLICIAWQYTTYIEFSPVPSFSSARFPILVQFNSYF